MNQTKERGLIAFYLQSQEKIDLLRMLGADVRPVPGEPFTR